MSTRSKRAAYWIGWAAFIAIASAVTGIVGLSESSLLRGLQRAVAFLDVPISAVGLVLPFKGAWLFFVPANHDRGVAPDLFAILINQAIIGIPTYLAIFWAIAKLSAFARSGRQNSEVGREQPERSFTE
jgi:uncharacterized membrane protein YhaH (DUF805 family)